MVTPLRIGTTGDYAPFSLLRAQARFEGFDIDLIDHLIAGPKTYVRLSWAEIGSALATARVHLVASGLTVTDERKRIGTFSRSYLTNRTVIVGRPGTVLPVDRLGVNAGGYLESVARAKFKNSRIVPVSANEQLPEQLMAGDFEAFLSDAIEAAGFAQRQPVVILQALEPQNHALLFQHALTTLQADCDAGLTQMIRHGQLRQLAQIHGIDPNLIPGL